MPSLFSRLFLRPKSLEQALDPHKKIKIHGIIFVIRKINPLDYLAGFKSMHQLYDVYKREDASKNMEGMKPEMIKRHYADVFLGAVITPQLARNIEDTKEPHRLWVEALFNNWEICEELYAAILEFTYGKKKLRSLGYQKNG